MNDSLELKDEKIIKSKHRVQKHGEVFTPQKVVKKMLDVHGVREACESITATFLEPSAGEGAFLVAILRRKLKMVTKQFNEDLNHYENYSLLALSTLYGIELLEDNAQTCVINMFQVYYEFYLQQVVNHGGKVKSKVLDSAKLIISNNISQGNFLTKRDSSGKTIVFSEWTPLNLERKPKNIKVERTEYTVEEIYAGVEKDYGEAELPNIPANEQLNIFDFMDDTDAEVMTIGPKKMKYIPVKITDIFKEEMEEIDG